MTTVIPATSNSGANAVHQTQSQSPQASMNLGDVILQVGLAAAKNNELRIREAYNEVLAITRMMENVRNAIQATSNARLRDDKSIDTVFMGYKQYDEKGELMKDRYGDLILGKELSPYSPNNPDSPNYKRHLSRSDAAIMDMHFSVPTYKHVDKTTGEVRERSLNAMLWGEAGSCAYTQADAIKSYQSLLDTLSSQNQIAQQNLQAAVSKQNELNQLVSGNLAKLHELANAALSKMA